MSDPPDTDTLDLDLPGEDTAENDTVIPEDD